MRQTLDKITTLILRFVPFVTALLIPIFFLPFTSDYFAFNKYFLFAFLASVSLLAWCIRSVVRKRLYFTLSPALIPLFLLFASNLASSLIVSPTKMISLLGQTAVFLFALIIFLTVTSSQKNQPIIKYTIIGLISSALLTSLFTIAHYFGLPTNLIKSPILSSDYFNLTGGVLPALTFSLPIFLGTLFYSLKTKNLTAKIILFSTSAVILFAQVINLTLILPKNGEPIIYILPFQAGWSIAIDTLKTWLTALFGTGPETFMSTFTRLRPAHLNLNQYLWDIRFSESSNYIFTLITTTGLLGSLSFIATLISPLIAFKKHRSNLNQTPEIAFILPALILSIIAYFVVPTGIVSLVATLLLLIALTLHLKVSGVAVKDLTLKLTPEEISPPSYANSLTHSQEDKSIIVPVVSSLLGLSLVAVYWIFASKVFLASVYFKQADALMITDPYKSFSNYQMAANLDRYNPYYTTRLSQIYLALANTYLAKQNPTETDQKTGSDFAQRALDAAKISARLDPLNVMVWENLAKIYQTLMPYAQGSADLAISHYLQAASLDYTNPSAYQQLGVLFYVLGDSTQAIKFLDRAIDLKQDWDMPYYNLSSIYKAQKDYTKALQYSRTGLTYTPANSPEIPAINEEIKSLEKMATPQTPSPTPTPEQI